MHLFTGKGIQHAWNALVKDLFINAEFVAYKAEHYKENEHRKVRDKYNDILKSILQEKETGNQSQIRALYIP